MSIKKQASIVGLSLFLSGIVIFMGIIIAESFFPPQYNYSTRNSPICGLGGTKPPNILITQPSANIYNGSMIVAGVLMLIPSFFIYFGFKKRIIAILLGLMGIGSMGVGLFPCTSWDLHYASAVLVFVSSQIFIASLFTFIRSPLRYVYLSFGIASLCTDLSFVGYPLIEMFGKGGQERLAIYPLIFALVGFGAYLMGYESHSE